MRDSQLRAFTLDSLLTQTTLDRIVGKEVAREYPLDVLNDMRALINYATHYFDQCESVWDHLRIRLQDRTLTSRARLSRLYMACFVSAAIKSHHGRTPDFENAYCRQIGIELSARSEQNVEGPPPPPMSTWQLDLSMDQVKQYLRVHALTRELADRLGLGEHPLYAFAPILSNGSQVLTTQYFTQRTADVYQHKLVFRFLFQEVRSWLTAPHLFTGKLSSPVLIDQLQSVQCHVDGEAADGSRLRLIAEEAERCLEEAVGLQDLRARSWSQEQLEVEKMAKYSLELAECHLDPSTWSMPPAATESILHATESSRFGLSSDALHAPRFISLIEEGIDILLPAQACR